MTQPLTPAITFVPGPPADPESHSLGSLPTEAEEVL